MIDEGYWTFNQLRKELEENGLTLRKYPDGRIRIDFAKGTNSAGLRNLTSILGYRSSNGPTYTPHISDRPVDIHEGLRYLTVSCNLVNREHNIGPYGNRSTVITSLPIDGTRPLFGTTTKYNDIESRVRVDAGKYSEIRFEIGSNTGIIPGDVFISTLNKMSILLGYDYFDTTAEDLDILKRKLAVVEKGQQGNTAEIVKHTNDVVRLNSLGEITLPPRIL
ncbi:Hypothetical predicted protein [Paramuricea clavata]|uniref:Uncharacterized protein n=1 Tax=Paramuricea clavata TaxID=317549 RepID=A0A6S7G2A9_PARCT|nr:Hypothetical predicted protein [Paramuricea clavata]